MSLASGSYSIEISAVDVYGRPLTHNETVVITGDADIAVSTEALTLATYAALIEGENSHGVQTLTTSLTLTTSPASIDRAVEVSCNTEALIITPNVASIQIGENVTTSVASLLITELPASIEYDAGLVIATASLSITTLAATIESTGETTLTPQDLQNIVDGIFSRIIEDSETFEEQLKLIRAEAAGKLSVNGSTVTLRDAADTKDRITATVDSGGQRTTIATDVS